MQNLFNEIGLQKNRVNVLKLSVASATLLACLSTLFLPSEVLGAEKKPEEYKKPDSNALELKKPDPLLPTEFKQRSLTSAERLQLKAALDELNTQADTKLKAGQMGEAFNIWRRELRLRRVLGKVEEVQALGKVGAIAWENKLLFELELIGKRLQKIKEEAFGNKVNKRQNSQEILTASEDSKIDKIELLQVLAKAYQQLRTPSLALDVYQQILAVARERQDAAIEEATLKTIAAMNMSWFDYPKAAAAYEELLVLAQKQSDYFNQAIYLQELANIYTQAKKPENSLIVKQRLVESYLNKNDIAKLPPLKLEIAADYEALGKPEEASQSYQEAYSLALSLQQFAYASEALDKLGSLYRSYDQLDYALQVYVVRLQVDQQTYNYYGLMNSYDKMGQIYLDQKNYPQAIAAFQQGLQLARNLKYQENYFVTQIDRASKQPSQ